METDMIKITHLKKSFGDVKAVNDLSFQVKKGELFAFLGVNGAGKSTTISIICGQLRKDSGTVQIQGTDLDKIGRKVGTMLGVVFLLILDEPTTGLDPQTRLLIWDIIEKLRVEEKLTVFLTTHYMEEAANAGYVVILDKGSIVAEGTPFELKNEYVQDTMSVYGVTEEEIKTLGREYKKIRDGYQLKVKNTAEATRLIVEHQEIFRDYEVVKGRMDDVFLAVTGKTLGGEHR